ncbi:condensation domain-containing protein, partial [Streptomyces albipurpureus]
VTAVQSVLDHHDVLRARLSGADGDGEWVLEVLEPGAVQAASCVRRIDVAGLEGSDLQRVITVEAEAARDRLALTDATMVQAVWFDAGPTTSGRLLVVVHHLVVDGVSWRILLPDLQQAWEAAIDDRPAALQPVGTSFRHWAQTLAEHAESPKRVAELALWRKTLHGPDPLLGARPLDPTRDTSRSARSLTVTLAPQQTEPLLTEVPALFHAGINDVLLSALVLAMGRWRARRGQRAASLLVDLEGHGREEIFDGAELSRTTGWFTSMFPVRLDPGTINETNAWAGGADLGRVLKRIKEQLRAVPDHGIGYGLLRYLNPDTATELTPLPTPQIGFNYLGRFSIGQPTDWTPATDGTTAGSGTDPDMALTHTLTINSLTQDTPQGPTLTITYTWPTDQFNETDIQQLADSYLQALTALTQHATQPTSGGRTPSDLPLLNLNQADIDRLESVWRKKK